MALDFFLTTEFPFREGSHTLSAVWKAPEGSLGICPEKSHITHVFIISSLKPKWVEWVFLQIDRCSKYNLYCCSDIFPLLPLSSLWQPVSHMQVCVLSVFFPIYTFDSYALTICILMISATYAIIRNRRAQQATFPHTCFRHLDLLWQSHLRDFPRAVAASSEAALITGVPPTPTSPPPMPPVLSRSSPLARSTSKPRARAQVTHNLFFSDCQQKVRSDRWRG